VGVFGATGYTGREVVRLLAGHPRARVGFTTGTGDGHLPHDAGLGREAQAYLLALPHGVSAGFAARLREARPGAAIIDLSGDLRLRTADAYRRWYGQDHPAPELLDGVPYGLPEVYRDRIKGARLVANPGCYATSVLLPLVPLLKDGLVDASDVVVDAKSGTTGAGRAPREDLLFSEVADDFSAYAPGRAHRHVGEMESVIEERTGRPVSLTFCPHLLPVRRGILSALYLKTDAAAADLAGTLRRFYDGAPFVRIVDGAPPRLSDVVGTNDCRISVHDAAPGRVVVFSALDNLIKGAAGQAVQNLNLALGWPETAGLPVTPGAGHEAAVRS
jgi:N-acetyl-gamma-glutamyl-phosphate reductase